MHRLLFVAAAILTLSAGAARSQNVAANSGLWWTSLAGAPGAFTPINPLTSTYLRFGVLRGWPRDATPSGGAPGANPRGFSLDGAWGGSLGMGARLMPVLRAEFALAGSFGAPARFAVNGPLPGGTSAITTRLSSVQAMGNVFIDFAPLFGGLGDFNVYVGGGVGVALNRMADADTSFNDPLNGRDQPIPAFGGGGRTRTNFAWQAIAGAQFQITRNLILDFSYAYVDAGHAEVAPVDMVFVGQAYRVAVRDHRAMVALIVPLDGLVRGW